MVMKIGLIMNHNSYAGREYSRALIEAGIEFSVISIGHFGAVNNVEEQRCGGLWQPMSFEEISSLVKCFNFPSLTDASFLRWLEKERFDLGIQGGTGILKENVFKKFRLGLLNFHPGDLPLYRGASAPEWQLYEGRPVISTCHLVDAGIDTGPVYKKKKLDIDISGYHAMRASVYPQTAKFVVEVVKEIINHPHLKNKLTVQDESLARYHTYIGAEKIDYLIKHMREKHQQSAVSEKAIRPAQSQCIVEKEFSREIKKHFLDRKTGKLKREIGVKVDACPACQRSSFKKYLKKNGFDLLKCLNCGMLFVNPRPNERSVADFFSKSIGLEKYSQTVEDTKKARKLLVFNDLARKIDALFPSGGKFLEVGSGAGLLMEEMLSLHNRWIVKGIEPNAQTVNMCRRKKLDVFLGTIENYPGNDFDVVVYWAVWDHFFDPFKIAKKTYDVMKRGARLIIGSINIDGFDSSILGKDNPAFALPERMNFFNPRSFELLLRSVGFKNIFIETTGKLDVDLVRDYWLSGGTNNRHDFLDKIILGPLQVGADFQKFLMKHQLSGHMTVMAEK